jgi:hypothetical protein
VVAFAGQEWKHVVDLRSDARREALSMTRFDAPGSGPVDTRRSPHAILRTLPAGSVILSEGLLAERQATNRRVSLRHGFRMLEEAGNFFDLRLAIGRGRG